MDFLAIKRNLKKDYSSFKHYKLALLSDAAPQYLAIALRGLAYDFQLNLEIYEANIGSVWQEINGHGRLYQFPAPQGVLIHHSFPEFKKRFYKIDQKERNNFSFDFLTEFKSNLEMLSENGISHVFASLIPVGQDEVFGSFGFQTEKSLSFQLQKINLGLMEMASENQILNLISLPTSYFDPKWYYNSQADISFEALPKVAASFLQSLVAKLGFAKKCLVIDLDNTIWGGIVGDDGWGNLEIGLLGRGKVFTDFQFWLKELKNRGVILAVCSKNNENTAKEVFEKNPEMVLQLSDIAVFVANWDAKSQNIANIAKILNIGTESMVFLDDNKAEREEVKTRFPEIAVPELPVDPADWLAFLQNENLFEVAGITEEDVLRTEKYQQEISRKKNAVTFQSHEEYLKNLEMKSQVLQIDSFTMPRVAQLLQRTNQFNLRTIRYSEAEIKAMMESGEYFGFALNLKDKFGDEGIVSAILLKNETDLVIDSWVMSCRVFGRGLEKLALNLMLEEGMKQHKKLVAQFVQTSKNQYIKDILPALGFVENNDFFELGSDVKNIKEHFILRTN